MKRLFVFFTVFALLSAGLSSQELSEDGNRISAVSVTGLKRTKPPVIEKTLQKFIGRDSGSLDTNEVYAVVQSTGILETQSVDILDNQAGNGKTLAVTVREKWAIFPVPLAFVNPGGWAVGTAFADTNAFGVKDTMGLWAYSVRAT